MRVSDIRVVTTEETCQIQGWVESDRPEDDAQWFAPFTLWHRFPRWCEPYLSPDNGDPFLAALLMVAMRIGERLAISAPISPRLLDALPEIQSLYVCFDRRNQLIPVEVEKRRELLPAGDDPPGIGLFFSLGVDSFYSLVKNQRDHPSDARTVTHLLSVHGFDVAVDGWDEQFPFELLANFRRVADEAGKTLVPVVSNVRRVSTPLAPWTLVHGGGMTSIALALGQGLRRVSIAASTTYDKLYPWGSHPVLDPYWSTEGLSVVHDGCEMNSIDKARVIAESQLVLETLRPCAGYGPGYNCGQCLKCLRTMLDLLQAGALDRCQTLPHQIDPEALRAALRPGGPVHVADFSRRLDALETLGDHAALCRVLREHLGQGMSNKWLQQMNPTAERSAVRRGLIERVLARTNR
jgi:hypothetical protein